MEQEIIALRAMLKYIEFSATTNCCPVCGGYKHHDPACVLAAFLYPESAKSYNHHTHDTHINEMLWNVDNVEEFKFLQDQSRELSRAA